MHRRFLLPVLFIILTLAGNILAVPADAGHRPFSTDVPQANGVNTPRRQFREPYVEINNGTNITVYSVVKKFNNAFGTANQNGGTLFVKGASQASWTEFALSFHANDGDFQYWKASFIPNSIGLASTEVLQYVFRLTFSTANNGSNQVETTWLYAPSGAGDLSSGTTTSENAAKASPFSFRDRPAWVFHANNRVVNGNNVQFRAKVGYQTDINDPATRWVTNGALYYTTDGSEPTGALGIPSGTTQIAPVLFDFPENLNQGTPNPTGTAMWWTTESLALPPVTLIKYRLGFWNTANLEEKFADHNAGSTQTFQFSIGNVGDPGLVVSTPTNGALNGNYTTTKLFIDENAAQSIPVTVNFQPGQAATQVELVTNLNQRDFANIDKNNNGEPDGIEFNQDETIIGTGSDYYYRSFTMSHDGLGNYSITLPAEKSGAYRLTARWKVAGDPAWRWFTYHPSNRRDHAITVTPFTARNINIYEINTLTIEANSSSANGVGGFIERSTFEDLFDAPNAPRTADGRGFNLDYLLGLGINWLWFQPIHPPAVAGREIDPSTSQPYNPGSPYAVKNFFEINPWMSADYNGTDNINSSTSRERGMSSFQAFVTASDTKNVSIMLDAPFNHTGFDVELAQPGVELFTRHDAGPPQGAATEFQAYDTRFFSRNNDYAQRATLLGGQGPAAAPDRGDFGKWNDTKDVYFGRYDALVNSNPADNSSYLNEGDRFYYAAPGAGTPNNPENGNWTSTDFFQGPGNTLPRNTTRQTWKYFARYATHWLEKTRPPGANRNSTPADGSYQQRLNWDNRGIDGLRCDFGQGLPPQAWEYMINVARSVKWNFVMMSESLDGGAVTYRSNRHFDILNENIVFPLQAAENTPDYRAIFESRRSSYGQGLVLLNNTSHDEENYVNNWFPLIRYNVTSTIDGAPMIFMGQELGVTRTSGFSFYETNFGKQVAHFKKFNSMKPGWLTRLASPFGEQFMFDAYGAAGQARLFSPALRSSNRFYLNRTADGLPRNEIWAVGKYENPGASPNLSDVVLAFVNLRTGTGPGDVFNVNINGGGGNLFGIKSGRQYNIKNIAAFTQIDSTRRNQWVWTSPKTGHSLLNGGFGVVLNSLPTSNAGWSTAPYEAQFLKLYDVTPPAALAAPSFAGSPFGYVSGNTVTFDWTPAADPDGGISGFYLQIGTTPNGFDLFNGFVSTTNRSVTVPEGTTVYARVQQVNNADIYGPYSASSAPVIALSPTGDQDGDGKSNQSEFEAGTNALDAASIFRIVSVEQTAADSTTITWTSVPGKSYVVESSNDMTTGFTPLSMLSATGATTQFNDSPLTGLHKFYRVRLDTSP